METKDPKELFLKHVDSQQFDANVPSAFAQLHQVISTLLRIIYRTSIICPIILRSSLKKQMKIMTLRIKEFKIINQEDIILFILDKYSSIVMLSYKNWVGDTFLLFGYVEILSLELMLQLRYKKVLLTTCRLPLIKFKYFKNYYIFVLNVYV